jgi:hypothetical protein
MKESKRMRGNGTYGLFVGALAALGALGPARADLITIDLSAAPEQVLAGTTFSFPVILTQEGEAGSPGEGSGVPVAQFAGYSLDVDVFADSAATGRIIGLADSLYGDDAAQSHFDLPQCFIAADPAGRALHPAFSVINGGGDGGVFVRALERMARPVGPADAGHDVLAELVFSVSPDAEGLFTFRCGPGTALLDATGTLVSFESPSATMEIVVPEHGTILLVASTALLIRRRMVHA